MSNTSELTHMIDNFYSKQIYKKFHNLQSKKQHQQENLSLKYNFPTYNFTNSKSFVEFENFSCKCDKCILTDELDNVDKRKVHIAKSIIKNRISNCEIRIKWILDMIYNQIEISSKPIVIIVPKEQDTTNKIGNLLCEYSQNKITKLKQNCMVCDGIQIYLLSPHHLVEGFEIDPESVGMVLLNCFYSHMFIKSLDYEELVSLVWKFRPTNTNFIKMVAILDQDKIFYKEIGIIKKICDDLQINLVYN